ncbi:hypothetical protein F2Q69_00005084 [Brassica cretica]|uniref:F-box associated beta-propeller type 3 domain-containing protein n=1 Tax=Brassica cretica TaxID=69181 RepID=A0A8S9P2Q1_BRACR|nr:hypothetical protein F2Q69_00005084 [Brassica cretica]
MPIDVAMNQLEELSLVNYQGKLGCTFYSKDRAEVLLVAGVTLDGEIVIMPKTLDSAQTLLYAYFYNPKENKTRRVEFETNLKGELEVCILRRFDVRFERFDHIQMPIDVAMNQLEELSLVNYQGKLGCTFYSKDRAEVWVMKDHGSEKHEWSKVTIDMSLPDMLKTLGSWCHS